MTELKMHTTIVRELEETIGRLKFENFHLNLALDYWDATFSKYESWKANKAESKHWPKQVLKDYRKCSKATQQAQKYAP